MKKNWRKIRDSLQLQHPRAKIKYSYKTKQFLIIYPLPKDWKSGEIYPIGGTVTF